MAIGVKKHKSPGIDRIQAE